MKLRSGAPSRLVTVAMGLAACSSTPQATDTTVDTLANGLPGHASQANSTWIDRAHAVQGIMIPIEANKTQ
jgi:hypothetical protein